MRRRHVDLPHDTEQGLLDGRSLTVGDLFTVHGARGRFAFRYRYTLDDSVTAWGPVTNNGSQDAQSRSFRADQVKRIYKQKETK